VGIGYPEQWSSYGKLKVDVKDALGNVLRAEQFQTQQELARLTKPVDSKAWTLFAHIVNAQNLPLQNALNFPAAILQAPFYDAKASDAQNYGAIGAVIGHEISHSFDDQGAQFDAQGRLRDWWTKEDLAHFKTAGAALAAQYSGYQAFPDLAVNGQQTLNENLADLAGISASLDAFHASLGSPQDTLKQDQAFFTGFAQVWRVKAREAALRRTILTNGHAPGQYRALVVRNLDAWYKVYDVQAGQKLYLTPENRVRVW
jgi:predicted metalloendopeptidase